MYWIAGGCPFDLSSRVLNIEKILQLIEFITISHFLLPENIPIAMYIYRLQQQQHFHLSNSTLREINKCHVM